MARCANQHKRALPTDQPPQNQQADILVSELLGSFGDNELSPECLDGAQRLLRPGGISIPASYTSFLAPITSCKMQEAVKAYKVRHALGHMCCSP